LRLAVKKWSKVEHLCNFLDPSVFGYFEETERSVLWLFFFLKVPSAAFMCDGVFAAIGYKETETALNK